MTRRVLHLQLAAVGVALILAAILGGVGSAQTPRQVSIDGDDIGGVVTGPKGPEAGVWVVAETTDLPTRLIKSVVTDDQGRYLVPDLPKATYNVWVRGYGLTDSPKTKATPGKQLALTAVPAPSPARRGRVLPGTVLVVAAAGASRERLPGHRSDRQWHRAEPCARRASGSATSSTPMAVPAAIRWATRPRARSLKTSDASRTRRAAWDRRIQSGQAGGGMSSRFTQVGRPRALAMWADWTDRIAGGELPAAAPSRPQGRERNVVVTMWDWADPKAYLHDEIASDKRNPTVNANGPIYGALEASADYMPVVDPKSHNATQIKLVVRDPKTPSEANTPPAQPSPYWGEETIWTSQANAHSFAMDKQARVWIAARIRQNQTSDFCKQGSSHPSAKAFPIAQSGRQMQMYDPKTKTVTTIDTCFGTHHLNFDDNDVLWFTGGGPVEGWFDTRVYDKTKDEQKAQGWTVFVLDTNGNGKRDAYVEPDQPVDPTKDKRINAPFYGVAPTPGGDGIWGSVQGMPGALVRLTLGSNPPETALSEIYEVPWKNPKATAQGFAPRGMDVDSNGVVWAVLSSGHLASFDRRKCKGPLNGPDGDRPALSRGLGAVPVPRSELQGRGRFGERRHGVLQLHRSLRHARRWQGRAARDRQRVGRSARARGRQVHDVPRAVSHGLLREGHRRPHRRSEGRLEGQGHLDDLRDARAVPR